MDPGNTECRWIETGQLTISNGPTRNQTWNFPSHDTVCSTLGVKKIDKEDSFGQHSGNALTLAWLGKKTVTKVFTYDTNKMCVSYQALGYNKAIVFC